MAFGNAFSDVAGDAGDGDGKFDRGGVESGNGDSHDAVEESILFGEDFLVDCFASRLEGSFWDEFVNHSGSIRVVHESVF